MTKEVTAFKKKGVFHGKKIFVISEDQNLIQNIKQSVVHQGAVLFEGSTPKEAIGNVLAKNPDLIIYDDRMPLFNGTKILTNIKQVHPHIRILLVTPMGVPQRSIDVSAQGVSYSIPCDSNQQQIYNAVKHCLAISSVPRVESQVV